MRGLTKGGMVGVQGILSPSDTTQRTKQRIFDTFAPELVRIIDAWPTLSDAARHAIRDIIERAGMPQDATGEQG